MSKNENRKGNLKGISHHFVIIEGTSSHFICLSLPVVSFELMDSDNRDPTPQIICKAT